MINTDIAVYYKIDAALSGYQIFKRCSGIIGDTDIIFNHRADFTGGLELLSCQASGCFQNHIRSLRPGDRQIAVGFHRYAFSLTLSLHGCCSFGSDIVDIHSAIGLYG